MRREFEMSEEQLSTLLDACKPVRMIALQCGNPRSPQENANDAWRSLGQEMGFDGMTVRPVAGKSQRFFTAVAADPDDHEPEVSDTQHEIDAGRRLP